MANYRQIHVSIWKDEWFLDLEPKEKLLFIYLFSNESASLAGIYKMSLKVICFETCLTPGFIKKALGKFQEIDKVCYQDGILWIKNLRKYNQGGATVQIRIENDILEIPHCELKKQYIAYYDPDIPYPYPIDSLSYEMKCNVMKGKEKNKPIEVNKTKGAAHTLYREMREVWADNFPTRPQPKASTQSLIDKVKARMKDEDFVWSWRSAIEKAATNGALHNDSWFTFGWLVRNDSNYQKLLDGYFDWKMGNNHRDPHTKAQEQIPDAEWKSQQLTPEQTRELIKNSKRIEVKE